MTLLDGPRIGGASPDALTEQRSTPLAASRRYYPGFFGALFLVLLRIAIGWHFLYEGLEKVESTRKGGKPFTAEAYLRNATGPLAPYFRGLVPDVNSLAMLDPDRLKAAWAADVERLADHYGFDKDQRDKAARGAAAERGRTPTSGSATGRTREKRTKYFHELRRGPGDRAQPQAPVVRARAGRREAEGPRRRPQGR